MGDSLGSGVEMYICLYMKGILCIFRVKEEHFLIFHWWARGQRRSILLAIHYSSHSIFPIFSLFIFYLISHPIPCNFAFWCLNISTGESSSVSNNRTRMYYWLGSYKDEMMYAHRKQLKLTQNEIFPNTWQFTQMKTSSPLLFMNTSCPLRVSEESHTKVQTGNEWKVY